MAKFHSSTFGAISGKHGSAVAVTRKDGVSYIRMHVVPHNPRTDKQQAHRSKIGLVSKSLAPFNPIFKHTMGATNGISIARSHAFKNAIVDEYPNFSIDYKKLMFSFGTLVKLQNATTSVNNGIISINWDFKKMHNCHGNDSVSLVVFNKNSNQAIHIEDIAYRKEKIAKIDIHEAWADSELYFWAYVKHGNKISDSIFVGISSEDEAILSDTKIDDYNDNQEVITTSTNDISNDLLNDKKDDVDTEAATPKGTDIDVRPDNNKLRTITLDQKKILLYLLDKESISMIDAMKLLNMNQDKAYYLLSDLVSKDLIVNKGNKKRAHYVFKNIIVEQKHINQTSSY